MLLESMMIGLLAVLAGVMVIGLAYYVIQVIAGWRIFTKMGEPGWKSLIPVYRKYVVFDNCWEAKWFWVYLGLALATGVVGAWAEGGDAGILAASVSAMVSVASFLVSALYYHKLSRAFGHDIGFTIGLIFLNPIFLMILAFSQDQYIGPDGIPQGGFGEF